ncbi:MAG: hypothetical protein K6G24_05645 [Lachnospiraceae bacterium]|nr:hypothetical protein [Lachnospiraceae bacterium]
MAGINSSITFQDKASETLRRVMEAANRVTESFRRADEASQASFESANIQDMEEELLNAASAAEELAESANNTADEVRNLDNTGSGISGGLRSAANEADGLRTALAGALTVAASIAAIGLSGGWLSESVDLANQQQTAERQLQNVLRNAGSADAYENILKKASYLQSQTMYGDEAYLAGAAELSRGLTDERAISLMMDTLSNYAAGMSGGQAVDASGMASYAEQLTRALNGSYTMLERNNFKITDEQKEIIEKGNDMQKALVISEVVNQSWGNLAKEMAELPTGKVTQFKNTWGDFREEIGERLQPAIARFVETLENHLPKIENLINKGLNLVISVIDAVSWLIDRAADLYDYIETNWSAIGPIIDLITTAIGIAGTAIAAYTVAVKLATAAHAIFASTAVKGLTSVVGGIGVAQTALTLLYDEITVDGKDGTYSALGVVAGAFTTVGATIWNTMVDAVGGFILLETAVYNILAKVTNKLSSFFGNIAYKAVQTCKDIAGWFDELFGTSTAWFFDPYLAIVKPDKDDENGNRKAMEELSFKEVIGKVEEYKIDTEEAAVGAYNKITDYVQGKSAGVSIDDLKSQMPEAPENPYGDEDYDPKAIFDKDTLQDTLQNIEINTAQVASNTSNNEDITNLLKLLRDISEREAINRFTTAEVKIDLGGVTQNISKGADADNIIDYIAGQLEEQLATVASKSNYGW